MSSASRYKILEKIGAGSFATVYRARDLELGREVAIKQMHDEFLQDPARLDRYWQEAQLLASFQHPNIVTVYDIVRERGWLVMELMQGNLAERLQGKQMDLRALRSMLAQVLRALKYLHAQGVIHGDVKPGNLMLDQRRRVKLGDFGLARRASDEQGSLLKGTTKYMAPEMVSEDFGDVGPASDLYSLGFAAYDLMCGPNFDNLFPGLNAFGRNRQIAWMMWHAAPDRKLPEISRVLDGVPPDVAQVVQKLTQKDQSLRYKSADEALSDLQIDIKLIGGTEEQPTVAPPSSERRRLYTAAAALAVSVLLSGAVLFWPAGKTHLTPSQRIAHGIVRSVDENAVVLDEVESAIPVEYKVVGKPKIFLLNDQKNILLKELQPGDHVDVSTAKDNDRLALSLTVDRPVDSRGTLKSVDLAGSQLILALEEGNLRDDLPLRIPGTAQLKLNGAAVKLNELQPGDVLLVRHLSEPGFRKGRIVNALSARRAITTVGYVAKFDAGTGELTIDIGRGAVTSQKKLLVGKVCQVALNGRGSAEGRPLVPNDLQPGDRVSLQHDVEILAITATRQSQVDGVIDDVSADGKIVTIVSPDNQRHPLLVEPSTDVTLSLERIPAVELRRFDDVRASYTSRPSGELMAATVDARRPAQKDRWGVVIGTQAYQDATLSPVKTANDDARLIHRALVQRYAMAEDRCPLLLDATKAEWQRQLTEVLEAATQPTQVVISITGHAYRGEDDKIYLAAKDFDFSRMTLTGLPLDWLAEKLNACRAAEQLLMLDVFPPGIGRDLRHGIDGPTMLKKLSIPFKIAAVLLPCRDKQRSLTLLSKQQGHFAWTVAHGFAGAADIDRNLKIDPEDLFNYVLPELEKPRDGASGLSQSPVLIKPE